MRTCKNLRIGVSPWRQTHGWQCAKQADAPGTASQGVSDRHGPTRDRPVQVFRPQGATRFEGLSTAVSMPMEQQRTVPCSGHPALPWQAPPSLQQACRLQKRKTRTAALGRTRCRYGTGSHTGVLVAAAAVRSRSCMIYCALTWTALVRFARPIIPHKGPD